MLEALDSWRSKLRFFTGLRDFLGETVSAEQARVLVERELGRREESFLRLVRRGIYENPASPYRKLLLHAGIAFGDLQERVGKDGLEATISALYDAGVHLTYEETRGLRTVRRGSLEFPVRYEDLDNPLLQSQYEVESSGTRAGSRSFMDLTLVAHEAAYYALLLRAHGADDAPVALWRPVSPSTTGIGGVLRYSRIGRPPLRWFSQTRLPEGFAGIRSTLLLRYAAIVSRRTGKPFGWPQYVPQDEARTVALWLAEMAHAGTPALLDTSASAATRISLVAQAEGIGIRGSIFRTGGEPYTPAKDTAVRSAGARAIDGYAASELGVAGLGCADGEAIDDMHVATDKLLVHNREKVVDKSGATVQALIYTTIHPNCRRIMLNAESGDCGELRQRKCGCLLGAVGLATHVVGLHGYDKLTSEGVAFMGAELYDLVERVLPSRYGGYPTDYQLVEEEDENGLPRVSIVVSPTIGKVDEAELVETALATLATYDRHARGPMMATHWRQGGTLRVLRREPYLSGSRKVMPLHVLK